MLGNGNTGNCPFPEGVHSLVEKQMYTFFFYVVIIAVIKVWTKVLTCRKGALSMENFRKASW